MQIASKYIVICSVLLMAACTPVTDKEQTDDLLPVKVEVLRIDSTLMAGRTHNYVGTVEAQNTVSLSFTGGGYIVALPAAEGTAVAKGQLLAATDHRTAQSAYEVAQATLRQAEDGYKRLKTVYEQGTLAEVKWVEMESKLVQARSMADIAFKSLKDCEVYAPFSGIVGKRFMEPGMNALPMQPVITLLDIDTIHISFSVPENEIADIAIGDTVGIIVSALDYRTFKCKIIERGVSANALSHSYTVKAALSNPDWQLLPGMVCKVQHSPLNSGKHIALPSQTVQTGSDGPYVWVNDNGTARRRWIDIGGFIGNNVSINDGLQQGDQVITGGYLKLSEGSPISIEP